MPYLDNKVYITLTIAAVVEIVDVDLDNSSNTAFDSILDTEFNTKGKEKASSENIPNLYH